MEDEKQDKPDLSSVDIKEARRFLTTGESGRLDKETKTQLRELEQQELETERQKLIEKVYPMNRAPGFSLEFDGEVDMSLVEEAVDIACETSEERKAIAQIIQKEKIRVEGLLFDPAVLEKLVELLKRRDDIKLSLSIPRYDDEQYVTIINGDVGLGGASLTTLNRLKEDEKGQKDSDIFLEVWREEGIRQDVEDKNDAHMRRRQMMDIKTLSNLDIWPTQEQIDKLPNAAFRNFEDGELEEMIISGKDWDLVVLDMNNFSGKANRYKGEDEKVFLASCLETLSDIKSWLEGAYEDVHTLEITNDSVGLLFPTKAEGIGSVSLNPRKALETIIRNFYGGDNGGRRESEFTNVNPEMKGKIKLFKIGERVLAMDPPTDPEEVYHLETKHKQLDLPEYKAVRSGD